MKHFLLFTQCAFLLAAGNFAFANDLAPSTIIEFFAKPDTGEDAVPAIQEAVAKAAQATGPVTIRFAKGRYDLFRDKAYQQSYYMSNTLSDRNRTAPDPIKTIAIWLKKLSDVTIDGQGSILMLHGEMTGFVVDECQNIRFTNLTFNMADPTVAEVKVTEVDGNVFLCETLPGTQFRLEGGKVIFFGEGWKIGGGPVQAYDPLRNTTWRCPSPLDGASIEETAPGHLRITGGKPSDAKVGWHYQFRDGVRDQASGFILRSRDFSMANVTIHFLHGFGILGQFSENLTFDHLVWEPDPKTGRSNASFADMIHMVGCRGKITVVDSRFSGAHDDAINVHGVHLRIISQPAADQVLVRFMHHETYGYEAFFPGDEVDFTRASTLIPFGTATVKSAERKSLRDILITFDRPVPKDILLNEDVVENVTGTAELEVRNCSFSRIPTRGILFSTRRKVLIENNTFFRMQMSGISILDDGKSWFESGVVRDATIRGNRFIECGDPVINIHPEATATPEAYVHSNIRILDNTFILSDQNRYGISAYSTDQLLCSGNVFITMKDVTADSLIKVMKCGKTTLDNNRVQKPSATDYPELLK